ncbi:MAG: glyoxylate/hydroxypyruvate reductase A, partial [Thermodesulfobacteriota bacterium]|nr:glyoxylate/hydroxypyruvate reductase A [Thermodesulfobacteriota bacterium]
NNMPIAIIYPTRVVRDWVAALHSQDPELKLEIWPEIRFPDDVEFALCWNHPVSILQQFPNLKCISSLGAGANHLLNDDTRLLDIPLVRLVDHGLKQSMTEYLMLGVLEHFRRFKDFRQQQTHNQWTAQQILPISELGIGIMGCGEIGRYVANKLANFGFSVHGWSRTPQENINFPVYAGKNALDPFLSQTNILICLLPLTPETENILNAQTFSRLPQNAYLINVARGAHLVEADLLSALDSGQLSGALLDVFREEPLPKQHRFWNHNKITITPHIASVTNPQSAAKQIVENYRRVLNNEPLHNLVNIECGY